MQVDWHGSRSGTGTEADVVFGPRAPSVRTCEAEGFSQTEARQLRAAHAAGAVRVHVGAFGILTGFDRQGVKMPLPEHRPTNCGPMFW